MHGLVCAAPSSTHGTSPSKGRFMEPLPGCPHVLNMYNGCRLAAVDAQNHNSPSDNTNGAERFLALAL
eukprot:2734799-Amphidinium_carterae.2